LKNRKQEHDHGFDHVEDFESFQKLLEEAREMAEENAEEREN
jgi:hypothetical protein